MSTLYEYLRQKSFYFLFIIIFFLMKERKHKPSFVV